jgi:hypothetical protein
MRVPETMMAPTRVSTRATRAPEWLGERVHVELEHPDGPTKSNPQNTIYRGLDAEQYGIRIEYDKIQENIPKMLQEIATDCMNCQSKH